MKFLAGLLLGAMLTAAFFITRPEPVSKKAALEFQQMGVSEAKKYAEATDPDEKLKAAEELYGKMMVLFLSHLGLSLKKSSPVVVQATSEVALADRPVEVVTPVQAACPPCAAVSAKTDAKKKDEKQTTAQKFQSSAYFSRLDPVIRKMQGVFAGKLTYFAGSRRGKIDSALLEVDLRETEGRLDGAINVILADGDSNVPYSRNRGRGGNKTIRHNESAQTIFVEASPNSFFSFRAGQFNRNDVQGEYYEDNALVGKVLLFRQ